MPRVGEGGSVNLWQKNASTDVIPCVTRIPVLDPSPDFQPLPNNQLEVDPRSSRSLSCGGVPTNLKPRLGEEILTTSEWEKQGVFGGKVLDKDIQLDRQWWEHLPTPEVLGPACGVTRLHIPDPRPGESLKPSGMVDGGDQ